MSALVYPGGRRVTRAHDPAGRLESVTDWEGRRFGFAHDPDANLTGLTYPNGVATTTAFDATSQVSSIQHRSGPATVAAFSYARTNTNRLASSVSTGASQATPQAYTYTPLQQLSTVNGASYAYDGRLGPPRLGRPVSRRQGHRAAMRAGLVVVPPEEGTMAGDRPRTTVSCHTRATTT